MKLGKLKIDDVALASQGNAILGIRDSGKTYTATLIAERMHGAGTPFIAFDPIGVWRFLRVPGKGPGIPVVVAGGKDGDLPLTAAGAPEIVRASMANGISLVIDLFDINLSKADWKRIVAACVRVLLHENKEHGLRHVFIEEAAEFAPQRIQPDQGQVYAEIEKLARMGGNSRLGYTLINQRAEEVNKAVLELCDNLFLHRQKGRNSLTALSKWLDIGNVSASKQIISTLPTLPTGECWAWLQGSETPELIKIPEKNSLHPDRRVMRGDDETLTKKAIDVGGFVQKMRGTLGDIEKEASTIAEMKAEIARMRKAKPEPTGVPEADVQRRIRDALASVPRMDPRLGLQVQKAIENIREAAAKVATALGDQVEIIERAFDPAGTARISKGDRVGEHVPASTWTPPSARSLQIKLVASNPVDQAKIARLLAENVKKQIDGITSPRQKILDVIAQLNTFGIQTPNKLMVAAHAGVSPRSSGYANNLGALRSSGMIEYPSGGTVVLTDAGRAEANQPNGNLLLEDLHGSFLRVVSKPQSEILSALIDAYPNAVERDELAECVGVSAKSSGFANNLGSLRTLGAVDYPSRGQVRAADFLFPNV